MRRVDFGVDRARVDAGVTEHIGDLFDWCSFLSRLKKSRFAKFIVSLFQTAVKSHWKI
jgi:hypothetical protein